MLLKTNNSYKEMFHDPFLACVTASKRAKHLRGDRTDIRDSTLLSCEIYLKDLPKIKYKHIFKRSAEFILKDILSQVSDNIIKQAVVAYLHDEDISKYLIQLSTGQQRRFRIIIKQLNDKLEEVYDGTRSKER